MLNWSALPRPIVALSPMADMTDSAFCRVAKRLGAPIMFREMISSEAIVRNNLASLAMGAFVPEERPLVQQIFGAEPATMAEAVRILDEKFDPDGFDVNMGCPVYKIVSNFNGAALMREPARATAIIRAMRSATDKPVSIKIRLGWSDPTEALEFIKVIEAAGAALVTIHGRTKTQGYSGVADWKMIGRAKARVSLPVLANGDIHSPEAAVEALRVSGCDGVLIARGALGNPWIFARIAAALNGSSLPEPTMTERLAVIRDHATLHQAQYGDLVSFRKHLSWYFKGLPGAKAIRESLSRITTIADLDALLA